MRSVCIVLCMFLSLAIFAKEDSNPLFISDIKCSENGFIFMTCKGDKSLRIYDSSGVEVIKKWNFNQTPTGLVFFDDKVAVTCFDTEGEVIFINLKNNEVYNSVKVGSGAMSPIYNKFSNKLYVCNRFSTTICEINLETYKIEREVKVLREPKSGVLSTDGNYLYIANHLPQQRADVDHVASCVSVIDLKNFKNIKDIRLENGSNALRDICISPDNKYLFISHNLGRYTVPTSQLQQGWMNTSALSVVDINSLNFLGSFLVDEPERGAAGTWGVSCTDEYIIVSHSGVHEISVIDYKKFLEKFEKYPNKENLNYDLTFLYGIRERIPLKGNGPRIFSVYNDKIIVPMYFSDDLNFYTPSTKNLSSTSLNPNRTETAEHKGERIFNDAFYCFQHWQSCNGCHPGDARMDGLNWDLMNDGIGNPKNCKSLLYSHVTPPCMISGIRENAELAVRRGFYHIQFYDIPEEEAEYVDAYLKALRPVPSPYLVNGELSEKAKRGKEVYKQLKCDECHYGPYYTDLKMYRIGDDIEFEDGWDNPTLIEVWRTAPYLFDGRAATMEDVFKVHKHGIKKNLSKKDMDALVEYVNSL